MSQSTIKSYNGFEEGSYASRKGRLCYIKKIHFEMNPPSVTVQMMDNNTQVGTEFEYIKPLKAWYCSICTAENTNISSHKCHFCNLNRTYKEKVAIKQPNEEQEVINY